MRKNINQPPVTFIMFAYNQERFIAEAVQGALSQTYSPLEIIISDDCSDDQTYNIINSIVSSYAGSHRIIARRNETNLGLLRHINTVIGLAGGDLLVVAAGDDISAPQRTERLVEVWLKENAKVIWSNAVVVDQHGKFHGRFYGREIPRIATLNDTLYGRSVVAGAMCAWDRSVFDVFGPLKGDMVNEDVIIPFRGALLGKVCYIDEELISYRKHGSNLSFFMKLNSSSPLELIELNRKNQANTLRNCLELKSLLEKGKNAGITDVDYEASAAILDQRIKSLNLEVDLLSQNFRKRLGILLKNRWVLRGLNQVIKFLLITFSPYFFFLVLRLRFNIKNNWRWRPV
jgi:glycosyltransferase involved in cell wall biosynthesis